MRKPVTGAEGRNAAPVGPSSAKFSPDRILVYDKHGTPTPLFPLDDSAVTSAKVSWTGLFAEQHQQSPLELPGCITDRHLIVMHFRTASLKRFLGGGPRTKRTTRGSLDIIPQGTSLGRYSKDETNFMMLSFDPAFVERVAVETHTADPFELVRRVGIRDPQIEHIAFAIKAELEMGFPSGQRYGDALAVGLAARLLSQYSRHVAGSQNHNAGLPAYMLRRVIEYINENLTKDLTLAQIAEVAHMNAHYFSRAFRQSTGVPPHRYVMNRRIEKAKSLLSNESLPLVEVGMSVGFQNQSHFTTLFHKSTGVTPKVYRVGIS